MSTQSLSFTFAPQESPDAGLAFDRLAADYDQAFTETLIGRAQRQAVWRVLALYFKTGDSVLELNCGTGVDASFLAKRGVNVLACDASSQMIATADRNNHTEDAGLSVVFCHMPTERIHELQPAIRFDGAFSNFSGINCMADLPSVAASLSKLLQPGAQFFVCCSTRYCFLETAYYLLHRQPGKALRRWRGQSLASLGGKAFPVFYHSLKSLRKQFAPHFRLLAYQGIGVAVPPTYLNAWMNHHPRLFRILCQLEPLFARLPLLRVTGDHLLLHFEKVSQ